MFKNRPMDYLFNELLKLDEARKWDLNYKKVFSEHVYSFNHSKLLLPEAWSICQIIIWAWNAPGWEYMFFSFSKAQLRPNYFWTKLVSRSKKYVFVFLRQVVEKVIGRLHNLEKVSSNQYRKPKWGGCHFLRSSDYSVGDSWLGGCRFGSRGQNIDTFTVLFDFL